MALEPPLHSISLRIFGEAALRNAANRQVKAANHAANRQIAAAQEQTAAPQRQTKVMQEIENSRIQREGFAFYTMLDAAIARRGRSAAAGFLGWWRCSG